MRFKTQHESENTEYFIVLSQCYPVEHSMFTKGLLIKADIE